MLSSYIINKHIFMTGLFRQNLHKLSKLKIFWFSSIPSNEFCHIIIKCATSASFYIHPHSFTITRPDTELLMLTSSGLVLAGGRAISRPNMPTQNARWKCSKFSANTVQRNAHLARVAEAKQLSWCEAGFTCCNMGNKQMVMSNI